ncbi:RidA family protein [Rhodoplanes sp. TEM]|uniref:RidA family protein n=1 Tax=Rhodoplanes tepidamans TaxID=200616 RepID=A0ABT5J543_RHOTP|nr:MULTISPECIES: RidA family protein [Rhodoplanes]MDC7784703.1 RidA family protein [Rhodoplanes tepidamans]MDC7982170.1 RidA family protein [Rhodoplanes sp. TEM]MDQ0356174.1 enamine deaminase RidA (YjgF/YER057c/UK114 family) [Rhodoplanes tepidamans]
MHQILQPEGWARPVGYANGILARGRQIHVGGQIGWTPHQVFESDDLVDQVRQTLRNVVAVLRAGGAEPAHIVSMTWYFVDKQDYLARLKEIGAVYREEIGRHYPAMAAVQVAALMEDRAKVEIQATAVVPE